MDVKFLDLESQFESLKDEMDEVWRATHAKSSYIGGPAVDRFERAFAEYQGVSHCVGVGNGTDALELALSALDLPIGSEVVVPANSFVATAEAVSNSGFTVRFADVDRYYNLDANDLARRITPKTSAVIAVHLYGQPADVPQILRLTAAKGIKLVEDCAQAHGAEIDGQRVGSFGDVSTFSFYPGKNLGAYGDGGAVLTNHSELAKRVRRLANHGRLSKFDHEIEGRNSRLDSLQAAVLEVKLRHLPSWLNRRREVARRYSAALVRFPDLVLPPIHADTLHSYHLYVIRSSERDALREHLKRCGVATGIHYPTALPQLPPYLDDDAPATPNATAWSAELLSLPIGEHLSDDKVAHVIASLSSFGE